MELLFLLKSHWFPVRWFVKELILGEKSSSLIPAKNKRRAWNIRQIRSGEKDHSWNILSNGHRKMRNLNDSLSDLITVYLSSVECTIIKHSCDLYNKECYINIRKNITNFLKTVKVFRYCFLSMTWNSHVIKKSFQS